MRTFDSPSLLVDTAARQDFALAHDQRMRVPLDEWRLRLKVFEHFWITAPTHLYSRPLYVNRRACDLPLDLNPVEVFEGVSIADSTPVSPIDTL